jgi:hypothetical protein
MVIQFELEPEVLAEAEAAAQAEGLSLEAFLAELVRRSLPEFSGGREHLYRERIDRIERDIEDAVAEWQRKGGPKN